MSVDDGEEQWTTVHRSELLQTESPAWTQGTSQASLCVVSAECRFVHLETGSRAGAENQGSVNIHRGPGNDPELTSGPSRRDKHDKVLKNRSSWASEMVQY